MGVYINRELSWLEFNKRVLQESFDATNPIVSQLNFLSIFASNLDEFFMVRVGSLWDQERSAEAIEDNSGLSPLEQIELINTEARELVTVQYDRYKRIKEKLAGIKQTICFYNDLTEEEKEEVDIFYQRYIYPIITPNVFTKNQSFPLVKNLRVNIFLLLEKNGMVFYGNLQLPNRTNRLIAIKNQGETKLVLLETVILNKIEDLFVGYKLIEYCTYRITRNADLNYSEEEAQDLLSKIEKSLKKRNWGQVVRLELEHAPSKDILNIFKKSFKVSKREIYELKDTLDLRFLVYFTKKKSLAQYDFKPFKPRFMMEGLQGVELFDFIKKKDRVVHLPYDSFESVLALINTATLDDNVLAIKQTLYRVSDKSPIIDALERAALAGKNVTVLLELKARFDEENNIHWSKRLEKAGALVIHGPSELKTHGKMLLIIRKEKNVEHSYTTYCHFATGNYNEKTAFIYEDIGVFTANKEIGEDFISIFNYLSAKNEVANLKQVVISPFETRIFFERLIDQEIANVRQGGKGLIKAKMNSLIDTKLIDLLYNAADQGVEIELVVRGICGLIPRKNIVVKSIIGRFLEHSRIYYFYQNGLEKTFISSMDWMERNFDRRVETLIPCLDKDVKRIVISIFNNAFRDEAKSNYLLENGHYEKRLRASKAESFNAQNYFLEVPTDELTSEEIK